MTLEQTISTSGLNQIAVKELASRMRGKLILPEDELYNEARKVHNGMIDKRPALIARCTMPSGFHPELPRSSLCSGIPNRMTAGMPRA